MEKNKQLEYLTVSDINKKECRYCLNGDDQDKLINPCYCEGSMQYVHDKCLSEWIKSGLKQTTKVINIYTGEIVYITKCELCKHEIKYVKVYKYSIFKTLYKLFTSLFQNSKNFCSFILHSILSYFLFKRIIIVVKELKFFKKYNLYSLFRFGHSITILISILIGLIDIILFYYRKFEQHRKITINFLNKTK